MDLALVVASLSTEPEDLRSKLTDLGVMVAESTRLGCAATRTGNLVPTGRKRNTGTPGKRIGVKHNHSGVLAEVGRMA
jgi:hypothetical protein